MTAAAARLLAPDLSDLDRVEDFVAWMERQPVKFEVIDGRLMMMAGSTRVHAGLTARVIASLVNQLGDRPCIAYSSDLLVDLGPSRRFYPDASVVCDESRDWTDRPVLVVEVLSPSTRVVDLGPKLAGYLAAPEIHYVLYLEQDRIAARFWAKPAPVLELEGPAGVVDMPRLGLRLELRDLYAGLLPLDPAPSGA